MSASPIEVISVAAGLEDPPRSAPTPESTLRLAVAAHVESERVLRLLEGRGNGEGAPPEPGVDLASVGREARIARSRELHRVGLIVAVAAAAAVLRPESPGAWLIVAGALFLIELAARRARRAGIERIGGDDPPPRRDRSEERRVAATPERPFPGTGREVDALTLAVDLGRPREAGRFVRHVRVRDLRREVMIAVRRLWLPRLEVSRRSYAELPGGPVREYDVFELPVGEEGGLLTALLRLDRQGEALFVEVRFRFLPPISRAFRRDAPLNPRRESGGLARDLAVSLVRSPVSWLGALGWVGSQAVRPVVAAIRGEDGVQERSLREQFADGGPAPALEAEVRQFVAALRDRLLRGLEESLVRRGISPGPVQDLAIRGDVVVAEEPPARAVPRRRRGARSPQRRKGCRR